MSRNILLLEPNYKNKYPPMGLMKLAMYHKLQGDQVVFYKGDFPSFVISQITNGALKKLNEIDKRINWNKYLPDITMYIKYGKLPQQSQLNEYIERPFIKKWFTHFHKYYKDGSYYKNPHWDRVCITTLFTFHWDLTIETIEFAKKICKKREEVFVGGIMASVVPDKIEKITGIRPYIGSLNIAKLPGDKSLSKPFNNIIIDKLPLDYSILEEIDYKYPATDAYYAYATRGCVNSCKFCAVPLLEGKMKHYMDLQEQIDKTRIKFGDQRNLLLLDNNAFASDEFDKIIDDIYNLGFYKGATFIPPNQLEIAIQELNKNWNDQAYIRLSVKLMNAYVDKFEGDKHDQLYSLLLNNGLLHYYTATREKILYVYNIIKDDYEKHRSKRPLVRFVDFNQGMDARLATSKKMAKLATIAIRPLRIAFDRWEDKQHYVNAVYLAKKNGIKNMSNYLLYNFYDKPEELYNRLRLNIDLCDKLDVNIYSFPMKYHPIKEEKYFSNRDYLGKYWSRKAIRTVQAVLNSTHGKIGKGRSFFYKAFGRNESEFLEMIQMPEAFIIKRWDAEINKLTDKWRNLYLNLNKTEKDHVDQIVASNIFIPDQWTKLNKNEKSVLELHLYNRENIPSASDSKKLKEIKKFEKTCPVDCSSECNKLIKNAKIFSKDNK